MLDLDSRLSTFARDLEGPVPHVALDFRIIELPADETLSVEDSVLRIRVECILCGVTDTEQKRKHEHL